MCYTHGEVLWFGYKLKLMRTVFLPLSVLTFLGFWWAGDLHLPRGEERALLSSASEALFQQHPHAVLLLPPVDTSLLFGTSIHCIGCHSFDPDSLALVDYFGNDVNIYDDWRSTMMANAARDPLWQAKVSQEVLINPAHAEELQTTCTACHAPMGRYTATLRGAAHYLMSDLAQDTLGQDGVSCSACHMISQQNLGDQFSGMITFDTSRVLFGPYPEPFFPPMMQYVGFEPVYSPHVNDAGMCASCHTLITNSVDLEGQFTGTTFVEQATYHEWLNSRYGEDQENISCQQCHMPPLEEPVVIAADYLGLDPRSPFYQHEFVGGNVFMLRLLRDFADSLGVIAGPEQFDETIDKTLYQLEHKTLTADLSYVASVLDTALFSVKLHNLAGHKFPSGYPSRRAVVEFWVVSEEGDTLFHSGEMDEQYAVSDEGQPFEPHHNTISSEDEVQIYELVMGDVNSNITTILERAYEPLKDNRLVPEGFLNTHYTYDTVQLAGAVLDDLDFNRDDLGEEGSGTDRILYKVPTGGYTGFVEAGVKVHYQAIPPKFLTGLFADETPEIQRFAEMYAQSDFEPVVVASDFLPEVYVESVGLAETDLPFGKLEVFPNPARGGQIHLKLPEAKGPFRLRLYDTRGAILQESTIPPPAAGMDYALPFPYPAGVYILALRAESGERWVGVVGCEL